MKEVLEEYAESIIYIVLGIVVVVGVVIGITSISAVK